MLGAVAEFERALIRERTKTGLTHARSKGRVGGTPGLRNRDPVAIAKIQATRRKPRLASLNDSANIWLPVVYRLRPDTAWEVVLGEVNKALGPNRERFTKV